MEIWDWLRNLYHKRYRYPTDRELQGKLWVINRFISFDPDLTEAVATVSKYFFVLKERYYELLYRVIPESQSTRVKNPKKKVEFNVELVNRYSTLYKVSRRETIDYLKILHKQSATKEIFNFVGLEVK